MKLTAACLILTGSIAGALGAPYNDPQGRFRFEIPAGWQVQDLGENGVVVSKGSAYCNVLDGPPAAAQQLVQHLSGQFGAQWTNFQPTGSGETSSGGVRSAFG